MLLTTETSSLSHTLLTPAFARTKATRMGNHPTMVIPWKSMTPLMAEADIYMRENDGDSSQDDSSMQVTTRMKYLGPYPCIGLRFPNLATVGQRERNATGISLDFVVDTAANTNTLNAQVAQELGLEVVGNALPGVGAAGAISGGETFMLGDCQLENIVLSDEEAKFMEAQNMTQQEVPLFMSGLTASALPIASPAAAGIMGVFFLNSFPGGVEFTFGDDVDLPPALTFYGDEESTPIDEYSHEVPIAVLEGTGLPSVMLRVNGVNIPALLDTGSPVTVVNTAAAEQAGLDIIKLQTDEKDEGGFNPFAKIRRSFKESQATAQAAAKGDLLLVAGTQGERVELWRTRDNVSISCGGANFNDTKIYVGNIPGLGALGGLVGDSPPPAAILGMDVLRTIRRMFYRPTSVRF